MTSAPRRVAGRLALALFGALLMGTYAARPEAGFLPYFALIPWTVLYTDPKRGRVSWLYFLLAAYLTWVVSQRSVAIWGWWVPWAMAPFFIPGWLPFPFLLRGAQKTGLPRAVILPVVWVAVEWLRMALSLGHFDIYLLGYSQARFIRLAQIADITGVYGVSFLVAAWNGLFADLIFALRDAAWSVSALRGNRRLKRSAIAVLGVSVLVAAYGAVRLATVRRDPGPRLAVVQPNVGHTLNNFMGVSLAEIRMTDREIPAGSADLIVWPENAILDDLRRKDAYLDDLKILLEREKAWLLVGAQGRAPGRPDRTTNSAFLVDETGTIRGSYAKQILYPWSEYVPFDGFLGRVAPSLQRFHRALVRKAWGYVSTGVPGSGMSLLRLPWHGETLPFAALICVENSSPSLVAEAGRMGARFFVNITSEGTLGGPIQEQLLRICMMRAIENRIPYVRAGNAGISGFIDADGRLRRVVSGKNGGAIDVAGTLTDAVALSKGGPTPYARSHDAFALACVLGALGLAGAGLLRGPRAPIARVATAAAAILVAAMISASSCGGDALPADCGDEASCRDAIPKIAADLRQQDAIERGADMFGRIAARYQALAPQALTYRAYFLGRSRDTLAAARACETVLAAKPTAATWAMLGSFRERMQDFAGALAAFREAVRLDPDATAVRFYVARTSWETGDAATARTEVDAVLAASPKDARARTLLAKLDLDEGKTEGAEAELRRAAADDPANLESRYYLARLAWREGRDADFRKWFDELRTNEERLGRRSLD